MPPAAEFGKDGQATAHFIAHGGGNALTLVQSDGTHAPQQGQPQPELVQGKYSRLYDVLYVRMRLFGMYLTCFISWLLFIIKNN